MAEQAPTPGEWGRDDTHRPRAAWWLVGLAIIAFYVAGMWFVGGEEALQALADASVPSLAGALILQAAVLLILPMVHRSSLRAIGCDLPYPAALQVSMTAFTVSHAIPGGGAVGAAAAVERLHRFGIAGPAAAASAALTGPLSLTTIAGIGAGGVLFAVVTDELPAMALTGALGALVVLLGLVGGIVAGLHTPEVGTRIIGRIGRLHARLRPHAERWRATWRVVSEHAPSAGSLVRIAAWSTVKWTIDLASLALVFVAFGEQPRLMVLLVGFGAAQLLTAIPSTPGAVGIFESGMVGVFSLFGVPVGLATTVVIVYRILETWLPTLIGLPVVLRPRT